MSFIYFWRKKIFRKNSWEWSKQHISKKLFCAEFSLLIHQSTQFFMEITNFILILLENVVKRTKTAKSGPLKAKDKNAVFSLFPTVFNKTNIKFVISIKNWIYKHVTYVFLTKKNFSKKFMGMIQTKYFKKNFCAEISLFIHQSTQFFTEITNFILVLLENLAKRIKTAKYRSLKGGGSWPPNFLIWHRHLKERVFLRITSDSEVIWYGLALVMSHSNSVF